METELAKVRQGSRDGLRSFQVGPRLSDTQTNTPSSHGTLLQNGSQRTTAPHTVYRFSKHAAHVERGLDPQQSHQTQEQT